MLSRVPPTICFTWPACRSMHGLNFVIVSVATALEFGTGQNSSEARFVVSMPVADIFEVGPHNKSAATVLVAA